jgi:hypothetical protein
MSTPPESLIVAKFTSEKDNHPSIKTCTWPELAARLTKHEKRTQKNGPAWSPATYPEGTTRGNQNVLAVGLLVLDFDDGTPPERFIETWTGQGLAFVVHSSFSSKQGAPKWRAVFPLIEPIPAASWPDAYRRMAAALGDGATDPSCKDAARLYYLPAHPPGVVPFAHAQIEGAALHWETFPDPDPQDVADASARFIRRDPLIGGGTGSGKPGDDFNARATIDDVLPLLLRSGWTEHSRRGDAVYLTRPDKSAREGLSAVLGWPGDPSPVLTVFTSSAPPFDGGRAYAPFGVLGLLEHGGRFDDAARKLGQEGFGDALKPPLTRRVEKQREQREAEAARAVDQLQQEAERPVVIVNARQQRDIAADAWLALIAANEKRPIFFGRDRGLSLLTRNLDGNAYIQSVAPELLAYALRRVCDLATARTDKDGNVTHSPAQLPRWLPLDMGEDPTGPGRLPRLRGVVGCPVVTRAGNLLTTPGYDPASGFYLDSPKIELRSGATREQAQEALGKLFSAFEEFPYQSAGDRANALALLLTPFVRPYITGAVPLSVVEAPTPGTGKSLLARCLLSVSTPGRLVSDGPSERERGAAEEWAKLIASLLASAPAALVLDNLRGTVTSGTLEAVLTSPDTVTVRRLGKSDETVSLDVSGLTMAATGNNATFQRDMARRCYFIRLDAEMEAPEARAGFSVPDLDAYVKEHRSELLGHVGVILSAWIAAGRPAGSTHKGSFERWAATLSGLLEFCGVEGFLASDKERAEDSDPETLAWRAFGSAWWDAHGSAPRTAKELVELAVEHEIVADMPGHGPSRVLGKKLQAFRGRVFGSFRLVIHKGAGGVFRFSLNRQETGILPGLNSGSSGSSGSLYSPPAHVNKEEGTNTYTNTHMGEAVISPTSPTSPTISRIPAPPKPSPPVAAGDAPDLEVILL